MTTVTAPEAENPKIAADLNLIHPTTVDDSSSTQPPPSSGEGGDGSKNKLEASAKASDVDSAAATSDVQKKMKRAERFGMTVQLSEAEKRNSRAERFGTVGVNGSDSSKQAEELKRKARAERFGTVQSATAPADVEVKKKARLARFGSAPKNDSVEEEKKKARAARFSQLDAGTKSNGNKSTEKKAGTDKAGGGT